MMMVLPMFNVIKLLCITTILLFAFIATTLLIYGMSGASACPTHWERDTYGGCSIPFGVRTGLHSEPGVARAAMVGVGVGFGNCDASVSCAARSERRCVTLDERSRPSATRGRNRYRTLAGTRICQIGLRRAPQCAFLTIDRQNMCRGDLQFSHETT